MSGDSQAWASSGRSRFPQPDGHTNGGASGGMGEAINGMFNKDRKNSLPMYKDKPYAYPGSRRQAPLYRRPRVALGTIAAVFCVWLFLHTFAGSSSRVSTGKSSAGTKDRTSWLSTGTKGKPEWSKRREMVRQAMKDSWAGYEKYAWGYDIYEPVTKTGRQMVKDGMGWIIVDALDTLMIMNLTTELAHAREWVATTLSYDVEHDVNTFETTIRMLGGLLSAHYLSTTFPQMAPVRDKLSDDLYLERATDLADRLMGAYNSTSGVPYASVTLHDRKGLPSHDDGGASSTAEATSLQLEMKYLSKLTGETSYWEVAEQVMKVVDDNGAQDGLVPIFLYAETGLFRGENIRLGSRGDSYYEYLLKQYLQTTHQEPVYHQMWEQALDGIEKHLITYSHPSNFTVLGERPNGLSNELSPKMDHLVCFLPGTIALGATLGQTLKIASAKPSWSPRKERQMALARELTKTCIGMYKVTSTGLAPEIAHFHLPTHPAKMSDFPTLDSLPKSPSSFADDFSSTWRGDYLIKPADAHNLQRPETVETLFYMWRITGDEIYREWGWEMFEAFEKHTRLDSDAGYSSVKNVNNVPPGFRDNMESFWLAETLKYFYLLFGPDDVLPLDQVVFNTEAHPFPTFELGKLFKTDWKRKPRRADGNLAPGAGAGEVRSVKEAGGQVQEEEMERMPRESRGKKAAAGAVA